MQDRYKNLGDYEIDDINLKNASINFSEEDMIINNRGNRERVKLVNNHKREVKLRYNIGDNTDLNRNTLRNIDNTDTNKEDFSDENIIVNREDLKRYIEKILNSNSQLQKKRDKLLKDNLELRKTLKEYAFLQDKEHVIELRGELEMYKVATYLSISMNVICVILLLLKLV